MKTAYFLALALLAPGVASCQEATVRPLFGLPAREVRSEFFGLGQYSRSNHLSRSVVYEQAKPVAVVQEAILDESPTALKPASNSIVSTKVSSFSRTTVVSRPNTICVDGQCDVKTVAPLRLIPRRRR